MTLKNSLSINTHTLQKFSDRLAYSFVTKEIAESSIKIGGSPEFLSPRGNIFVRNRTAAARAAQPIHDQISVQGANAIDELAAVRGFSSSEPRRLKAATNLLKLWSRQRAQTAG